MNCRLEKELEFYRDTLKILAAFVIAVGGGTAGLVFKLDDPKAIVLFFLGLWLETGLIFSMARVYLEARNLLERIKDE
ncbi:MAG: hypothetical protein DSY35_02615 [Desulfurobacterium sp.]|nr:MAG: hypothetical protein DSY35_02615 [Desulfurobacterium sp.]